MLNNRVPIIIVSVVIVISMVIGGVLLFIDRDEPINPIDPPITDAPIDDNFGVTLDPSTGNYVIEFDKGNEVYLDSSLIAYWTGMDLHKRAKCGIICISGIEKGYHNGKGQVQRRNEVANRQVRA